MQLRAKDARAIANNSVDVELEKILTNIYNLACKGQKSYMIYTEIRLDKEVRKKLQDLGYDINEDLFMTTISW